MVTGHLAEEHDASRKVLIRGLILDAHVIVKYHTASLIRVSYRHLSSSKRKLTGVSSFPVFSGLPAAPIGSLEASAR